MRRQATRWTARLLGLGALVAAVLGLSAATASAVIVTLPTGKTLSYQPLRGAGHERAIRPFDAFFKNLDYNGGPVMPSNTNYTFYWRPAGAPAYPSDYQPGLNRYFEDLAHDSKGNENVDSVATQYNDAEGEFASYESHFAGALVDANPYPANGCSRAVICLTDAQIQAELARFVRAHKLPVDLTHEYFLLTPPGVESCFEPAGFSCSAGTPEEFAEYCAYHGNIALPEGQLIYANDPYVTGNGGCDSGKHPNASTSDGALQGGLSHEHVESVTDPEPNNAWTDFGAATGEIGDKCAGGSAAGVLGPSLGTAENGSPYNQLVNGHKYLYQEEWSNQGSECMQRLSFNPALAPLATFKATAGVGNEVTLDATGSTATAGTRYNWQFNEGSEPGPPEERSAPTLTIKHTFGAAGTYNVALTVMKSTGTSTGVAQQIMVGDESPQAAFTITTAEPLAGAPVAFDASSSKDPDGTIVGYEWSFGDGAGAIGAAPARSHIYAQGGLYPVTVTVTDSAGHGASATQFVFVEGSPALPSGEGEGPVAGGGPPPFPLPKSVPGGAPPPSINPGVTALTASVGVSGTSLTVKRSGQLAAPLWCAGRAPQCSGELVLLARQRFTRGGHFHTRTVTLASARFAIPAGTITAIKLKLGAPARALLRAARGRLAATLQVQKFSPSPAQTLSASVRLLAARRAH